MHRSPKSQRSVLPARRLTVVRIAQPDGGGRDGRPHPRTAGALALAPGHAAAERRRPHLSVVDASPPHEAAEATVRLVAEVLAGTCPPRHLAERALPDVWRRLAAHRAPLTRGPVTPPKVLRTWVQNPSPRAMESGAVVVLDGQVHALAVRLERHHGKWRCTAIETTVPVRPR